MSDDATGLAYLIAAVCFVVALRGLSSPETARRGNLIGIAGMVIAIAATLGPGADFDYIGVDRAEGMRRLGERLAVASRTREDARQFRAVWAADLASIPWSDPPRWRPVIVIVSYLFASPTLDADVLVNQLVALWSRLGRGEVTVLYTNSIRERPNLPLAGFHEKLTAVEFRRWSDHEETIEVERSTGPRSRTFRCALWHRPPLSRL